MAELKDPILKEIDALKSGGDAAVIKRVVQERFEPSRAHQDSYRRNWDENYDEWRGKLRLPKNYPLHSRGHIPLSFAFVESMTPYYVDALFDDRQFVVGLSNNKDHMEDAKIIGQITNYQYIYQIKILNKLIDLIRMSLSYGTTYAMPFMRWDAALDMRPLTEEEKAQVASGEIPMPTKEGKALRIPYYTGPDIRVIEPYDGFPDYEFQEVEDMRYFVIRRFSTMSRLKEIEFDKDGNRQLFNLDKLAETHMPADATKDRMSRLSSQNRDGNSQDLGDPRQQTREDRSVELLYEWSGAWLNVVGNRSVNLFSGPNPLPFQDIPVIPFRGIRDPGFFYGMAMLDVMKPLQKSINMMHNMRFDNLMAVLNPMWKIKRSGAIATRQLAFRPNGYIHVNAVDDASPIVTPDVTGTAMANIRDLLSFMETATGVQEFFRGEQPDSSRFPASGIALLLRSTTGRFKMTTASYYEALRTMFAMTHELNKAHAPEELTGRFSGNNGFEFPKSTRDKFRQTFVDLVPVGKASSGNPDFLLQKLTEWGRDWKGATFVNEAALARTELRLGGLNNIDEIIKPDSEIPTPMPEAGQPGAPQAGGDPLAMLTEALGGVAEGGAPQISPEAFGPTTPVAGIPIQPSITNPGGGQMVEVPQ